MSAAGPTAAGVSIEQIREQAHRALRDYYSNPGAPPPELDVAAAQAALNDLLDRHEQTLAQGSVDFLFDLASAAARGGPLEISDVLSEVTKEELLAGATADAEYAVAVAQRAADRQAFWAELRSTVHGIVYTALSVGVYMALAQTRSWRL